MPRRLWYDAGMADGYIHGFSESEQRRLFEQAAVLAPGVFKDWDLSGARDLLEIGCGVGAELELIRARWPHLKLTGLDRSPSHLAAGRAKLPADIGLVEGDATAMPFAGGSFDRVITIWMLEHVPDPGAVIRETMRVLRPGGQLICTEVNNDTLRFDPPVEAIARWWSAFNRFQQDAGGDPYIGKKLVGICLRAGARDIRAEPAPILDSRREPERKRIWLDYLQELFLSGEQNLLAEGYATAEDRAALLAAFARLRDDAGTHFTYFATRLTCASPGSCA
ncbi:MAG TPA: methyltransferase domain-containing protein [Kiritimatiellia bacterium]|jgi:SAM-dependent methyltransferase